jgi:chromosomal replication initiator protein
MLLVDDIQFLAGKEETQIMFFNVFNLLVSRGKQIVLTSDRAPSELKGLQDRLVSRFAGGLTISISSPNKDTLVEILKMKIQTTGLSLDLFEEEVLEYLAFNYSKNVRELEGAFTRLLFAITTHRPQGKITLSFAKEVFEDDEKRREKKSKIDVDSIIKAVADYYSLTEAQIKSKVRTSQIALARQIAMYLCRSILSTPYQEIGRQFGKDHTTVLANVSKIQSSLNTDASLKKAMDELTKRIKDHK